MAEEPPSPPQERTFGPYPGDALAPPPTPQAPEIPMSSGWLYVAGGAILLKYAAMAFAVLVVLVLIAALLFHWL